MSPIRFLVGLFTIIIGITTIQCHAASDAILPLFSFPLKEISQSAPHKKAVVIVHGWNSEAVSVAPPNLPITGVKGDWPFEMAEQICSSNEIQGIFDNRSNDGSLTNKVAHDQLIRVCHGQNWDVWVLDWSSLAGQCTLPNPFFPCEKDPEFAYWNTAFIGDIAAKYLESFRYNHIHLIAHSAGSGVIDTIKKHLLDTPNPPDLHITFLDPYDPSAIESEISRYGENAKWVDNYLDTSSLGGDLINIDDPANTLYSGYNFDATKAGPLIGIGHRWPYKFYIESTNNPSYLYGFPLSLESGGSMEILSSLKPYRTCKLGSGTAPCSAISIGRPVRRDDASLCVAGSYDCPSQEQSRTSTGKISIVSKNSETSLNLSIEKPTAEPVGILLDQIVPDNATHLSFDYQFDGDDGGFAVVVFDGKSIRLITSAYSGKRKVSVSSVWLGSDVIGGPHSFGIVLKNPLGGQSSLQITNIRFERKAWAFSPKISSRSNPKQDGVLLEWTALRGGVSYEMIFKDSEGNTIEREVSSQDAACQDETGSCQTAPPDTLSPGKISWRVRARNETVEGDWSDWGSFQVTASTVAGDSSSRSGGGSFSLVLLFIPGIRLLPGLRKKSVRCSSIKVAAPKRQTALKI